MSEYIYVKNDSKFDLNIDYKLMKENWDATLIKFNFKREEIDSVYQICSLILNIGNLTIEKGIDSNASCTILKDKYWENVLTLTGALDETLEKFILNKVTVYNDDIIFKFHSYQVCVNKIDCLVRALYWEMVEWLAKKTSVIDEDQDSSHHSISVVDFSGFENLRFNNLETLCINYSNEKMSYLFREKSYWEEKTLFDSEGLDHLSNNLKEPKIDPILYLLDGDNKKIGILQVLEKTSTGRVSNAELDKKFVTALKKSFKNNELFEKDENTDLLFTVKHSSSTVTYCADNFHDKFRDEVPLYIFKYLTEIQKPMNDIFRSKVYDDNRINWMRKGYSVKYKLDVKDTIDMIENKNTRYIKCIAPNFKSVRGEWSDFEVIRQLNGIGLEDYINLKKILYPLRMTFRVFCKRYLNLNKYDHRLFKDIDNENTNFENIANSIIEKAIGSINQTDIAYGKTMIFMKPHIITKLEQLMNEDISKNQKKRSLVKKMLDRHRLRKGIKNFGKIMKKRKQNAINLFSSWLYKVRDYPKFVSFLDTVENMQRDFRIKITMRNFRAQKASAVFLQKFFKGFMERLRYLHKKRSSIRIQKWWRRILFWQRVGLFTYCKDMLRVNYSLKIWPQILTKIQEKAATKIQAAWRGYRFRRDNPEIIRRIKEAGRNYKQ